MSLKNKKKTETLLFRWFNGVDVVTSMPLKQKSNFSVSELTQIALN